MCVCVCVCLSVVDQRALGTQWPLRPEGLRGQLRPPHPCLMHHPALRGPPPQSETAKCTQSGGLDGTLGKTARIIDPKLFSWRSLAWIRSKGCKHGDRSNLVSLESTTLRHITHWQHVEGHLRQMAQGAIPVKLHTSHVNPMCPWRMGEHPKLWAAAWTKGWIPQQYR